MTKLYDAHAHVGTDYFYHKIKNYEEFDFSLKKLLERMKKNGVEKSIVSQCPSIKEITCCASADIKIENKKIVTQCPKCKKILARLNHDPYRDYNIKIAREIEELGVKEKIIPFFIIHLQNPLIREEIDFYKKNYKNFGLKFHTLVSRRSIISIKEKMKGLNIPLLVHTGEETYCHPNELVEFSKSYKGKIIMAHAARLSIDCLKKVNQIKNLFVDVTPLTSFYRRIMDDDFKTILEKKEAFNQIRAPSDVYHFLLKYLDYKKLLFGTDAPWCDKYGLGYGSEVKIFNDLELNSEIKESIAYKNFDKLFN